MIIVVQNVNPPLLELTFTSDEIQEPLLSVASERINSMDSVKRLDDTKIQPIIKLVEKDIIIRKDPVEPIIEPKPIDEPSILSTIIIEGELSTDDPMNNLGKLVDGVREKYCGDVTPPELDHIDTKTKEPVYKEKDLTECPCYKIGIIEKTIEEIEPEPIEEEEEEPKLQEVIN